MILGTAMTGDNQHGGWHLQFEVPVVSWTPFRSMEQLAPLALFIALQILQLLQVTFGRGNMEVTEVMLVMTTCCFH